MRKLTDLALAGALVIAGFAFWLGMLTIAYRSDVASAQQGQYRVLGAQGAITTRDSAEVERAGYSWGN